MSDSLRSHGLQHTRLPCPSLSPGVCSHSCPLSPLIICLIMSILSKVIRLQRGYVTCPRSQVRKVVKEPGSLTSARYPLCRLPLSPGEFVSVGRACARPHYVCVCVRVRVSVCARLCVHRHTCDLVDAVTPQHVGHLCVL